MAYQRPLKTLHQSEIIVENSRFITSIEQATTVKEARQFIENIRVTFPNANHHVYAFIVGFGNSVIEGMSDDGEPTGTSGPPTLAAVRGSNLGDIVLVTTRYFGGKKLGTGGLVRAYADSAKLALSSLIVEINIPKVILKIHLPYSYFNRLKQLIQTNSGKVLNEVFEAEINLEVELEESIVEYFIHSTINDSNGNVVPTKV